MACKNCNDCNDNGCPQIVYPDCILTKIAYPCLGLAAGKTGTQLLAAIEAAICAIPAAVTVEGCIVDAGTPDELETITVTPTATGYKVCLGEGVLDGLDTIQTLLAGLSNCVFDASGDCLIPDILINVATLESAVADLESCVYDASGNCKAAESWKTMTDASTGNMMNGEAVPSYSASINAPATLARLRHQDDTHVEIQFLGIVSIGLVGAVTLFTLPATALGITYRPAVNVWFPVTGMNTTTGVPWTGVLEVNIGGTVVLTISDVVPLGNEDHTFSFCVSVPID